MTKLDWIVVIAVGLTTFGGYRRGLIGTALGLVGLVLGAFIGARVAPHFLAHGQHSRYTALVGLGGAVAGIVAGRLAASIVAKSIRGGLHLLPPLHFLDSIGGAVVGALWGIVLVWIAGAVVLQLHHRSWTRDLRHSKVMHRLDRIAPPHEVFKIPEQLGSIRPALTDVLG